MILENVKEMWTEVLFGCLRPISIAHAKSFVLSAKHACQLLDPWNCCNAMQVPKTGKGKKAAQPVNKDRFITKMFLRGDSVILVLRNPK